jgi:hypothetical protein
MRPVIVACNDESLAYIDHAERAIMTDSFDDLSQYIIRHYDHLLTPVERQGVKGTIRPVTRSDAVRSDSAEDRRLAAARRQVVERVLREHTAEVVFNRCPKCEGLCRTPKAHQCFRCGHAWHEPAPAQPVAPNDSRPSQIQTLLIPGLPAEVCERVGYLMQDDGRLTLEEFLERQQTIDFTEAVVNSKPDFPQLSERELRLHSLFSVIADLEDGWLRRGVARRLSLDDPGELARFLSMNSRVKYLWYGGIVDNQDEYTNVFDVLRALAARDLDVALAFANTGTFPLRGRDRFVLAYNGVYAVLRRSRSYYRAFERALSGRKITRWFSGMCECLRGIMRSDASLVAKGLDQMLKARSIWNDPIEKIICLEALGLHELARWVSPNLVSEFNPDRPLPWDRKFHEWSLANLSPMRGVRLPGVPLVIRKAILLLERPRWLVYDQSDA